MIEFADTVSVNRAMMVASRKRSVIGGKKFRVYKAGTGTYICNYYYIQYYVY